MGHAQSQEIAVERARRSDRLHRGGQPDGPPIYRPTMPWQSATPSTVRLLSPFFDRGDGAHALPELVSSTSFAASPSTGNRRAMFASVAAAPLSSPDSESPTETEADVSSRASIASASLSAPAPGTVRAWHGLAFWLARHGISIAGIRESRAKVAGMFELMGKWLCSVRFVVCYACC